MDKGVLSEIYNDINKHVQLKVRGLDWELERNGIKQKKSIHARGYNTKKAMLCMNVL